MQLFEGCSGALRLRFGTCSRLLRGLFESASVTLRGLFGGASGMSYSQAEGMPKLSKPCPDHVWESCRRLFAGLRKKGCLLLCGYSVESGRLSVYANGGPCPTLAKYVVVVIGTLCPWLWTKQSRWSRFAS
ncbi:hypothetical protein [Sphingobacterium sp. SYP-B4668]|uniref:hypothetical protein n=1 Tax=Sphingobacterium sp. SYP-B4668 TaxID=2996035 RepID=UPI0022DDFDB4|nr:hypothetical protein [Sphingobacterium sp. SYP-B4668]